MVTVNIPDEFDLAIMGRNYVFQPFTTLEDRRELHTALGYEYRVGYIVWRHAIMATLYVINGRLACERRIDGKCFGRAIDELPLAEQIELLAYATLR